MVRIPFLWKLVQFKSVFCRNLRRSVSSLMDIGILAFTITLFYKKFLVSSGKHLVCQKIFVFCQTDSFGGLPWLFFRNHWVSNILFHMPADGSFWILQVWSHIWYFWISFFCMLMQIYKGIYKIQKKNISWYWYYIFRLHILLLVSLQPTGNSLTTIRYTQQKWDPLMPVENNGSLQKWNITKAVPEIDKYDTHKRWRLQKWHTLRKDYPVYQRMNWVIFKRKLLNLLYDSDSWSWDFKVENFPIQNDIYGTLLCLIAVGLGSISRMLLVVQKTNNVVVRCHLCWLPFLGGGIFDERNELFVTLCQWVP